MLESREVIEQAVRNHQRRFGITAEMAQMRFFNSALLAVISQDECFQSWVLKGGSSLNFVYYGAEFSRETRDLDFVIPRQQPEQLIWDAMGRVLGELERRYGIRCSNLRIDFDRPTPKIEIRHQDYERDVSTVQIPRSKIDADRDEHVENIEELGLAKLFPEINSFCNVRLKVYSLSEILAEKLRAMIQRQDNSYLYCKHLYDISFILGREEHKVKAIRVLELYRKKCYHAGVNPVGASFFFGMAADQRKENAWAQLTAYQSKAISFSEATKMLLTTFFGADQL